jgi:hypothetical protein
MVSLRNIIIITTTIIIQIIHTTRITTTITITITTITTGKFLSENF